MHQFFRRPPLLIRLEGPSSNGSISFRRLLRRPLVSVPRRLGSSSLSGVAVARLRQGVGENGGYRRHPVHILHGSCSPLRSFVLPSDPTEQNFIASPVSKLGWTASTRLCASASTASPITRPAVLKLRGKNCALFG